MKGREQEEEEEDVQEPDLRQNDDLSQYIELENEGRV